MAIVLASVNILAYLLAPFIGAATGAATVAATLLFIGTRRGRSRLEKLLTMLLVTMPLYALPMLPGLHHVASWTTLLLVVLMIALVPHITRLSPAIVILTLVIVAFSILTGMSTAGGTEGWYYIAQFLMLSLPVVIAFTARSWIGETLDRAAADRLLQTLASTQLALALGVLVQWLLHERFGISVGSISFFAQRVTFDLTVSAYSVLSGILAIGMVLAPTLWRRGHRVMAIVLAVTAAAAIVANSARTGIVTGVLFLVIALLFPPQGTRRFGPRLALIPAGLLAWGMYEFYMSSARGTEAFGFFGDNGRLDTIGSAFDLLFSSDLNLFLGVGYADFDGLVPHNFIVETLVSSGLIAALALFALIGALLVHLRRSEWQYAVWSLLGASMFFAGFYAVKAATVVAVVMIVLRAIDDRADAAPTLDTGEADAVTEAPSGEAPAVEAPATEAPAAVEAPAVIEASAPGSRGLRRTRRDSLGTTRPS